MSTAATQPNDARCTTVLQFGFLSQQACEQAICLTPEPVQIPCGVAQLVPGGWGIPHVIAGDRDGDAKLYRWGDGQQQNSTSAVAGDVTCAAVGWEHAVYVSKRKAFVCELSKPDARRHELDLHGQSVIAVAAGEHHRWAHTTLVAARILCEAI